MVLFSILIIISGKIYYENKLEKISAQALKAQAESDKIKEKIDALEQSIYEDIPGIVAWGDSLTAGAGGSGVTYPNVLQELINENIYDIPVVNMGVGGENTNTIMGRAGSVPFVVDAFTIPADRTKVEINIHSSNGNPVAPLRQGDGGVNPVTIAGVEGIISIEQESSTSKEYTYYFQRSKSGNSVYVKEDTIVYTASFKKYNNYIPIIFMGQNGGYEDAQDLINQINSILDMDKWNEKFLVLGLTTGDAESRRELESLMESEYGDRYLNLRNYLSKNGLEIAGLEPTAEDKEAIAVGAVPPSLLSDKVHFNSYGYKVIGHAIYERMQELGYFDNILKLVEKINEYKN